MTIYILHALLSQFETSPLLAPGPRDPTGDWARPAFEFLSVSCRGMDQQWPAAGIGVLTVVDLGDVVREPHHRATEQTTDKLENNYTKEVLALLEKF